MTFYFEWAGAFSTFKRRLQIYIQRIAWLVKDGFRHFHTSIFKIVALNIIGIGAAAGGFGGAFLFLHYLEKGKAVNLLGHQIVFGTSMPALLCLFSVFAALGILSAVILFYTEWLIAKMTIRYQKFCIYRIFEIVGNPEYEGWQAVVEGPPGLAIKRISGITVRLTALAFREILQGILPCGIFVFAGLSMVVINPVLTLALVPLIFIYMIFLYIINWKVSQEHRQYRKLNPVAQSRLKKSLMAAINSVSSHQAKLEMAADGLENETYNEASVLFYRRKLANNRVQVLNTTFFFLFLLGLFLFFIATTSSSDRNWSELLAYIVALRFAISGLRQVTGMFVKLSRFWFEYKDYTEFVDNAESIRKKSEDGAGIRQSLPDRLTFFCEDNGGGENRKTFQMKKGSLIWIIQAHEPTYSDLKATAVALSQNSADHFDFIYSAHYFAEPNIPPGLTLGEVALGHNASETDLEHLYNELKSLGLSDEIDQLPNGLHAVTDSRILDRLSGEIKYALATWDNSQSPKTLFLTANPLTGLKPEFIRQYLLESKNAYKFILTDNPEGIFDIPLNKMNDSTAGYMLINHKKIVMCGNLAQLLTDADLIKQKIATMKSENEMVDMDLDIELDD